LRNPWRNCFDRETGEFYIADVGQFAWEEINYEPADFTGGRNYGWRCMEGNGPASASGCAATLNRIKRAAGVSRRVGVIR
jgi:hypothetical protein